MVMTDVGNGALVDAMATVQVTVKVTRESVEERKVWLIPNETLMTGTNSVMTCIEAEILRGETQAY